MSGLPAIDKAKKGAGPLTFLIILLIALLITTAGGYVARVSLFRPVEVLEGYWSVSDIRVERAKLGDPVAGHVVLHSLGRFEGEIVFRIRADIRFWFDKDISTRRIRMALSPGEVREVELDFRPDRASAEDTRGYFLEVDFGLVHGKWTMPRGYPPRLVVGA